ncbi:MAG: TIGR00266 family protein [bacterium]|nr:TIGR00266 family protein [bacterium]
MDVQIKHQPSYSLAVVNLTPNEQIRVESGSMVSFSDGVSIETKAEGGFFGGLKRMVAGESFFVNTYTAPAEGGEVTLAPALPGDMRTLEIQSGSNFLLQSGSYLASESGVQTDASWGGAKGFFGSGSLVLLRVSGSGTVLIASYGAMEERILQPGQRYNVDTGHIVGFDSTVQFEVKRVGGWKSTFLSGEGLVCQMTGPGRVLMQTRSEEALINWILPQVPQKSN